MTINLDSSKQKTVGTIKQIFMTLLCTTLVLYVVIKHTLYLNWLIKHLQEQSSWRNGKLRVLTKGTIGHWLFPWEHFRYHFTPQNEHSSFHHLLTRTPSKPVILSFFHWTLKEKFRRISWKLKFNESRWGWMLSSSKKKGEKAAQSIVKVVNSTRARQRNATCEEQIKSYTYQIFYIYFFYNQIASEDF